MSVTSQTALLRSPLRRTWPATLAGVLLTLAALPGVANATTFVPLNPQATYLHTYQDNPTPPPALALRLSDHGLAPGDRVSLQVVGDIDNGPGGDTFSFTLGLFSSSNALLGNGLLARVPGALVSDGPGFATATTYFGAHTTDIPQDFGFDSSVPTLVTVPAGAIYLFLAKHDQLYHDNSDPDHDYGVVIGLAPVPEPSTWAMAMAGVALLGGLVRRRGR